MDGFRLELFTRREKRAAAIFGIASVLLVASALAVRRPLLPTRTAPAAAAAPTPAPERYASFWFTSPNTAFAVASLQPMAAGSLGVREDLVGRTHAVLEAGGALRSAPGAGDRGPRVGPRASGTTATFSPA